VGKNGKKGLRRACNRWAEWVRAAPQVESAELRGHRGLGCGKFEVFWNSRWLDELYTKLLCLVENKNKEKRKRQGIEMKYQ
jgi:hypothetical protein